MKRNDLTLLLTFYKINIKEIKRWIEFYNSYSKFINIHFLFDGVEKVPNILNQINEEDKFLNKENVGKLRMIYNHVKNGSVKTEYFKAIDPDDYISFSHLSKLIIPSGFGIVSFSHVSISKIKLIFKKDVEKLIDKTKIKKSNSFGNSFTIINTKQIYNDSFFLNTNIRINDDQILGLISYLNLPLICNINDSFYLYIKGNGQLSNNNFLKENIETTLDEAIKLFLKSGNMFFPPINWPSTIKSKIKGSKDEERLMEKIEKINSFKNTN